MSQGKLAVRRLVPRFVFSSGVIVLLWLVVRVALSDSAADDAKVLKDAQGLFKPLPKDMALPGVVATPELTSLGRRLFFEPRISADGTVSCSRCHLATLYATDGLPKSHAVRDFQVPRNAPTILNSAMQFAQHWGGELKSVEEQAQKALLSPAFANPDFATAMGRLKAIPGYADLFRKAFPDQASPITEENWGQAVGAYERTLVTPSRFDEFLNGKINALSSAERRGLQVFISTGCADCHDGSGLGGGKFEKFGVSEDYWPATHSSVIDRGRIGVTNKPDDLYVFKVPILRNVEMTPPYFHDGSVHELKEAVQIMARIQLGSKLSDDDLTSIITFLKCLTGKLPDDFVIAPILPPSGFVPKTTEKDR